MPKASAEEWVIAVFAVGIIVTAIIAGGDPYQLDPGERVTVPRGEADRYTCDSYARATFTRPKDMALVWCVAPDEPCCVID